MGATTREERQCSHLDDEEVGAKANGGDDAPDPAHNRVHGDSLSGWIRSLLKFCSVLFPMFCSVLANSVLFCFETHDHAK